MWRYLTRKWNKYRYRFVPWLAVNLKHRTSRSVPKGKPDKIISDEQVDGFFKQFFTSIHKSSQSGEYDNYEATRVKHSAELYKQNIKVMFKELGFAAERRKSNLADVGRGVIVTEGTVPPGCIVSMYPGTIYQPYEAILLASLGNPFIFRCLDRLLIDGNDKSLSKLIYRSCCQRDRIGIYPQGDLSWLTQNPINPLAVGQYVNNQSKRFPANVAYQEFDVPLDFPVHLRQYIPNVWFTHDALSGDSHLTRKTRVVVLVSTRAIHTGEELYSSYFTIVQ